MIAARMCSGRDGHERKRFRRSVGISTASGVASFAVQTLSCGVCVADMWRESLLFRSLFCASLQFWPETKQGTPFSEVPCSAMLCASLRGLSRMGDTGFEPIDVKGLTEDEVRTFRVHTEEPQHVVSEASGHPATPLERPNDVQTHAPCGTGVARNLAPDLLELTAIWDRLPEPLRQSWLLTARLFVRHPSSKISTPG